MCVTDAAVHHVGLDDGALPADVFSHGRAAHLQVFHLQQRKNYLILSDTVKYKCLCHSVELLRSLSTKVFLLERNLVVMPMIHSNLLIEFIFCFFVIPSSSFIFVCEAAGFL